MLRLLIVSICLPFWLASQHLPPIKNFTPSDYLGHQQNWSISQTIDNTIHVANSNGILHYDGYKWTNNPSQYGKIWRSVLAVHDTIYTGTYGDFGYWVKDNCNSYSYHSLKKLIPSFLLDKEEIWHIIQWKNKIYFQSFSKLWAYDGTSIQHIALPGPIMFAYPIDDVLYIQVLDDGIFSIDTNHSISALPNTRFFAQKTVTCILKGMNNTLLIATDRHGLYTYTNQEVHIWSAHIQEYLSTVQINKMIASNDDLLLVGTIRDGLLIFNQNKELIYHFHTKNGLQNNTILSLYEDRQSKVWVGLDKGITCIDYSAHASVYDDHNGEIGTTYCLLDTKEYFYIGTNQGLYYYPKKYNKLPTLKGNFALVEGTQGQVWQLFETNTQILCGHNEGTYSIHGTKATKVSDFTGGWDFCYWRYHTSDSCLLQGTYTGIVKYQLINNLISTPVKIRGFERPVKKLIAYKGHIFVSAPNQGIHKLAYNSLDNSVRIIDDFNSRGRFSHSQNIDINLFRDTLFAFDQSLLYYYSNAEALFIPYKNNNVSVTHTIRSPGGSHWFALYPNYIIAYDKYQNATWIPSILNKDYHSISWLGENNYGLCTAKGYEIINLSSTFSPSTIPITFDYIMSNSDTICISNAHKENSSISIPYTSNTIEIYFHQLTSIPNNQFQYKLEGAHQYYQNIPTGQPIILSGLPYGKNKINLKTINNNTVATIEIVIEKPWHLSWQGLCLYLLIGTLLFAILRKIFSIQLDKEKRQLALENARILREQSIALENSRLTNLNIEKSKELANATNQLVQKNKILQEIKEEIGEIKKTGPQNITSKDFQNMVKLINQNMSTEEDKNLFEINFEEVHAEFFSILTKSYPNLSAIDKRLAAFLRMDLSSKDIAPLFNISIRGLENKRYRLRKKLNLPNDENLTLFLQNLLK